MKKLKILRKFKKHKKTEPIGLFFGKPCSTRSWYYTKTSEINEGLK